MANTVFIRVDDDDVEMMMSSCKELFLKEHPEFKGMVLSRRFMFKKVINQIIGE